MACQKFRAHALTKQYTFSSRSRFQISTWRSILTDISVSTVQNKVLNSKHSVTCEVLTKMTVAVTVFWEVTPLSP